MAVLTPSREPVFGSDKIADEVIKFAKVWHNTGATYHAEDTSDRAVAVANLRYAAFIAEQVAEQMEQGHPDAAFAE